MTILLDNLHDVNSPIVGKNPCKVCGEKLIVGGNWRESSLRNSTYICIDCNNERSKQWYLENKERKNEQSKLWHLENKEYHNKINKQWGLENPEKTRKHQKKYRKTIIGKFKTIASSANRRCNIKITYKELICLYISQNGYCPVTNTKLNFMNMHIDHIKSISVGGTNNYDNLIFMKHVANTAKNGFGIKKFMHEMGELISKEQKQIILKRIDHAHNRYEFIIDQLLEMTDDELTEQINNVLTKSDSIKSIDLLNT